MANASRLLTGPVSRKIKFRSEVYAQYAVGSRCRFCAEIDKAGNNERKKDFS